MSTIDTVESVCETESTTDHPITTKVRRMLNRYAALLEAVNRPVTDEQVEIAFIAMNAIFNDSHPEHVEGLSNDDVQLAKAGIRAGLEAHMAALREEVGE